MESLVFLVECSSGRYEDARTWIHGVFTDKNIAQGICDKMNEYYKNILDKEDELNDMELPEDATEEEEENYSKLRWDLHEAYEWNSAKVIDFVLNKENGRIV